MKASKKAAETKFVLTLSPEEAGLLMTTLFEQVDFADSPIACEVYELLEDAGAEQC